MEDNATLKDKIKGLSPFLVSVRRHLHQYPELSEQEWQTQTYIMDHLRALNIPHQKSAQTGVIALLEGKEKGPVIGLRADIDALPMKDEIKAPYHSTKEGICHACGHDAHTAIALGVLKFFAENPALLKGSLKVFFQPAEETVGGAQRMVLEGGMENPKVDYMIGKHVMPYLDAGHVEIKYGKLNAASSEIKIVVKGRASHGAYPEKGIDAILVSAALIQAIQSLIARNLSPLESGVITLGTIHGGTKQNTLCDEVTLSGTLRAASPQVDALLKERLSILVPTLCASFGAIGEISFEEGYHALINDDEVVATMERTFKEVLGPSFVHQKELPSMGVEDFSFFLEQAKGAFYHLGCGNQQKGITAPTHATTFDIDESCLWLGVFLDVSLMLQWMNEK